LRSGRNDGILTAEEVVGTDLFGTRLVTISACESGLGESKAGEGVYGLRRAFALAGAQNLVMSLWKVNDLATKDLMVSMYKHIAAGETPPRALLAAQREYIATARTADEYPHPYFWAAFVANGTGTGLEPPQAK
jgi:CHAT domain-containing protein